jgi:hypothetical protein
MGNKGTLYPQLHEQLCDYGFAYDRHYTDVVFEDNSITVVCAHSYRHWLKAVTLQFYSDNDDCIYVSEEVECEKVVNEIELHSVAEVLAYAQQFQIN